MKTITLRNDFHHTTATVRPAKDGYVSERAMRRAARALCPLSDCTCAGECGTRGPQVGFVAIVPASVYYWDVRDKGFVIECK